MGVPPISGRPGPDRKPESKQTRVGRGAGRGCAERGTRGPGWPLPPARSPHGRRGVPGEAALAVVAPLAHGEHAGVGRAGEEEVAHVEGSQRAESPALARAAEALQAAAGLGAHAGGAAAARCGARASPREGGSEGGSAATAGLQGTWALRSLGAGAEPRPRPGAAGGREGLGVGAQGARRRESACTHQAEPRQLLVGEDTETVAVQTATRCVSRLCSPL